MIKKVSMMKKQVFNPYLLLDTYQHLTIPKREAVSDSTVFTRRPLCESLGNFYWKNILESRWWYVDDGKKKNRFV